MTTRLSVRHRFDHDPDTVAAAVLDADYQDRLVKLPKVAERRVTEQSDRPNGRVHRVVHYRFGADLPAAVTATIGGDVITWDEIGDYDPQRREWNIVIRPKVFRSGFEGRGTYRFAPSEGGTVREVDLEMRVKVPLVGGRVERAIRDGLRDALDEEARILSEYLNACR